VSAWRHIACVAWCHTQPERSESFARRAQLNYTPRWRTSGAQKPIAPANGSLPVNETRCCCGWVSPETWQQQAKASTTWEMPTDAPSARRARRLRLDAGACIDVRAVQRGRGRQRRLLRACVRACSCACTRARSRACVRACARARRRPVPAAAQRAATVLPGQRHGCASGAERSHRRPAPSAPARWAARDGAAAGQVEGAVGADGRSPSIWDHFAATPGRIYQNQTRAPCSRACRAGALRPGFPRPLVTVESWRPGVGA